MASNPYNLSNLAWNTPTNPMLNIPAPAPVYQQPAPALAPAPAPAALPRAMGTTNIPLYRPPANLQPQFPIGPGNHGLNDPQDPGETEGPPDTFVDPVTGQPVYGPLRDAYIAGTYYPGMTVEEARNRTERGGRTNEDMRSLFKNVRRSPVIDRRAGGGGTGGGSEALKGLDDPSMLVGLNPYIDRNVDSFSNGGVLTARPGVHRLGENPYYEALYDVWAESTGHSDPSPTTNYYTDTERGRKQLDMWAENRWRSETGNTALRAGTGRDTRSDYAKAYEKERKRRKEESFRQQVKFTDPSGMREKNDPTWAERKSEWEASRDNIANLKNPWEEGYDDWYGKYQLNDPGSENIYAFTEGDLGLHTPAYEQTSRRLNRSVMSRNPYDKGGRYSAKPTYNQGGYFSQQANQAIAMNQVSGIIANAMNKRMPEAAYGMKMKKRYTNGGRF